jgi:uncharacterized protein (DUF433 family)
MESQPIELAPMELKIVQHITVTPGQLGGKPHIDGRRITVADVAFWHLEQEMPVEELVTEFDLSLAQIHAALAYYYDHREEIDRRTAQETAMIEELAAQNPSPFQERLRKLRGE